MNGRFRAAVITILALAVVAPLSAPALAVPLRAATALNAIRLAREAMQTGASAARPTTSDANAATPGTVQQASRSVAPELEQAWLLAESGAATQAEKIVRQFLGQHAQSPEAHFMLGYILFREVQSEARVDGVMRYSVDASLGKFRDAHARESLAEYTEGAKYATPSAFDLKIVAFDYILLDDSGDADKWLTRVVEWNPKDADAWYNLGRTKYTENRFDEAIHAFQQCLALDVKNVKAEDNLGLSYYGLGRTNDALAAYQTAIEWEKQPLDVRRTSGDDAGPPRSQPPDPQPFIDLGILYLDQNRSNDALPVLLQATQIAPNDAKGHEELGKAYTHLDDLPKAQAELEKAVALAPNVASLHFMLGQVYRRLGMMDKAKAEFERTEQLNGTHSSDKKPQ
jgi:tetratricopeptide (TPR) repeat protein